MRILLKNLLVFIAGVILSLFATILFAETLLRHTINEDVGLGIVALAPMLIIFYLILFGILGGIIAVAIYNIVKILKK